MHHHDITVVLGLPVTCGRALIVGQVVARVASGAKGSTVARAVKAGLGGAIGALALILVSWRLRGRWLLRVASFPDVAFAIVEAIRQKVI